MKRPIIVAAPGAFERSSLRAILKELAPAAPLHECRDAAEAVAAFAGFRQGFAVIEETILAEGGPALGACVQAFGPRCIVLQRGPSGAGTPIGRWAGLLPGWLGQAMTEFTPPSTPRTTVPGPARPAFPARSAAFDRRPDCVLVASSTGGPGALSSLLAALPAFDLPWVVAQHMPAHGTAAFAQHIGETTGRSVREAGTGQVLQPREILILAGGRDFALARQGDAGLMLRAAADSQSPFHPNADCLMASAADLGLACIVLVLSGMGRDGAEGALRLARAGNPVFVQRPDSCVVSGMPQAALDLVPEAHAFDPAHPPEALVRLFRAFPG